NALARKVHDRMPVLLQPEDFDRWLAGATSTEMLKHAPDEYLQVWPVSRRGNSSPAPSDDQTLIEPIAATMFVGKGREACENPLTLFSLAILWSSAEMKLG